MKPEVKLFLTLVTALAAVLLVVGISQERSISPEHALLWVFLCVVSEHFWVKTPSGDSVQSLAATAKLAAILILHPWTALLVIFTSTVAGNFLFRRSMWYRALYNGSQLMLAAGAAALVYRAAGGRPLLEGLILPAEARTGMVLNALADRGFLAAFFLAGLTYIVVNNSLMAWLMSAMTGRRVWRLWRENCLYPEEIQSSITLVLLTPLLVLLYGTLGLLGLILLFACLALVHQANLRYLAVLKAQDDILRSERMTAMGEMAVEIGLNMGKALDELKVAANRLYTLARRSDADAVHKSAQVIDVNVGNMNTLVEGLASFSHQDSNPVPTDLNELLRRTIDFVKPQNRFEDIHFKLTPDPIMPLVNVDPAQMQQVFINIFSNAADALTEVDRPVKKVFVETQFDPNAQRVRISISDNGPGIPEANLHRIFEPHFTTKVTGHGFGLATVFRIAANHRGTIRALNVQGPGAQFLLDIPNA
jgi:signal transduction histidine kinase